MGIFTRDKKAEADKLIEIVATPKEREAEGSMVELNGKVTHQTSNEIIAKHIGDGYGANLAQGGMQAPEFNPQQTKQATKAMYLSEPWIYTTASTIARTMSEIPFKTYNKKTDQVIENHPLTQMVNSGGVIRDQLSTKWASYLDLALTGDAFLVNLGGGMKEFIPVEQCEIIIDYAKGLPTKLKVNSNVGGNSATFDWSEVIHYKMPNPFDPWTGISPFLAAARPILLDRYKNEFEMAFYLRGCTQSGIIETQENVSRSGLNRMLSTFEKAFTGRANWWRTIFLPKGAKWVNASLTMRDMEHLEGLRENRKTIMAVMGIPPSIVGLVEDVNRATSEQQERIFYNNTIAPLCEFVASAWNNTEFVKRQFGADVELRPDFEGIAAMEESAESKKEKSESMRPYFTIDEIRSAVFNEEPIGDERGSMLEKEISGGASTQPFALSLAAKNEEKKPRLEEAKDDHEEDPKAKNDRLAVIKAVATTSQNRLEDRIGKSLETIIDAYIDGKLKLAKEIILDKGDVRATLNNTDDFRIDDYMKSSRPILTRALDLGFSVAGSQVKVMQGIREKRVRFTGLSEQDKQAVDVLRAKEADGQRSALMERAIESFKGFDKTQTEAIMALIERGFEQGMTFEQIAAQLRSLYDESYRNQTRTIVRTEILGAVSRGLNWNHQVLGKVFSDVNKQWLHQGDVGSNPDARSEHAAFEAVGEVGKDYQWESVSGSRLAFPRDPRGEAGQIINCRCTMVSVIPENSQSNAQAILETEI